MYNKRSGLEKLYGKLFVPVLIGGLGFIGYVLYNQGGADAVHEIYERGGHVVLPGMADENTTE